ncbi:MAG: hypothetical protein IJT68_02775 [Lentisphaeria bacterium]|nr:hypothetical protein [Lentisphaeria bacterium]
MKNTDFSFARHLRSGVCAFLLGLALPLAAHPAGDYLPEVEGAVTLLTPDQVKGAPFLPDAKNNPLFLKYEDTLAKLEAKHIKLNVHSLAVFGEGFLMNSSATPATMRYILKYKLLGEQIAWTETGDTDRPAFNLTVPDGGSFRITFPAKDWLLCAANRPPEPADDPSETKQPESKGKTSAVSAATLLKALPDDVAMAYVWPEPGATPEYPLMGELESISFHVVRDAKDKRPVHAELAMPAKTVDAALKIQRACQETIDQVYGEAAKLGKIPPELVNAFTAARKDAEVTIRIALPDDMAKYFFTTFAASLQEEVKPFAVPDKLK